MVCDFCYVPLGPFAWTYQTSEGPHLLELPGDLPAYEDDGLWGACLTCKAIIDSGDTTALIARSMKAQGVEFSGRDIIFKTEVLNYFMENRGQGYLPVPVKDGQRRQRA